MWSDWSTGKENTDAGKFPSVDCQFEVTEVYSCLPGMLSRRMSVLWVCSCVSSSRILYPLINVRTMNRRGVQFRQRVGLSWQEVQGRCCSSQLEWGQLERQWRLSLVRAARGHRFIFDLWSRHWSGWFGGGGRQWKRIPEVNVKCCTKRRKLIIDHLMWLFSFF